MLESNYRPSVGDGSPRTSILSNSLKNLEGSPFLQSDEEELDKELLSQLNRYAEFKIQGPEWVELTEY